MRLDAAGPRTWLLATLAGWALIAWLLALAGMGRRVEPLPPDPALQRPLPPLPRPAPPVLGPPGQYVAVGARPLFTSDRRPKPFAVAGANAGGEQAPTFDYVLTSVMLTPRVKLAILQSRDGSQSVRVRLGEAPEAQPGWRLTALDPRRAVFEGPEGQRALELRVFDGQGGAPPTAVRATDANAAAAAVSALPVPPPPAPPAPTATSEPAERVDTAEAQMDAIRRRIEARRAALRQQQQQQQQQQQGQPTPTPAPEPTP
ncbi:MAG TPA: hypothetical protein VEY50_11055 [Lysobacter sp.]|nr:hypothetical protein [Lysobacter sp.]